MAQQSVKTIADDCLGVSPKFSVVENFFGYTHGYSGSDNRANQLSLKDQMDLMKGEALDLNAMIVGHELFSSSDYEKIEFAIQWVRRKYAQVDIGIRGLNWEEIDEADADDYIADADLEVNYGTGEFCDVTNNFSGPSGALDLFVVVGFTDNTAGVSPVDGSCTNTSTNCDSGCMVKRSSSSGLDSLGKIFAHEIGHYLGLEHPDLSTTNPGGVNYYNIMTQGWISGRDELTSTQGTSMKNHCHVTDAC